jgi:hypothetical protein
VKVAPRANPDVTSWLTNVYGPQGDGAKIGFLQELCDLGPSLSGPWAICGISTLFTRWRKRAMVVFLEG